jgi:uncharacterized RDD family membrane protein YckC
MYCNHCGQPVSEGARYCSACGAPVGAAAPGPGERTGGTPSGGYGPPPPPSAEAAAPAATPSAYGTSPYAYSPPAPAATAPVPVPEPVAAPRYAGFWRRFWGLFVDRFALTVVLFPVGLLFGFNLLHQIMEEPEMTPERFMSLVFGSMSMWLVRTFAEWVYFSAFQSSSRQATLGQMLLGIKVTGLDGRPIGFARATGRYFASWLSAATLLIGFIMAAFTQRKQALHDMIAGTLVVRT